MAGAPIMPMGQAILLASFPRHLQPTALVMWGVGAVFGPVLGPILGSMMTEANDDWRSAFFMIVPPGIGINFFNGRGVQPQSRGDRVKAKDQYRFQGALLPFFSTGAGGAPRLCLLGAFTCLHTLRLGCSGFLGGFFG